MSERTGGEWWTIEPPDGWEAEWTSDCFEIVPPTNDGAFQLSAHRKDSGPVTDGDLLEFAEEHLRNGAPRRDVKLGEFAGFEITYDRGDMAYREWYLRCRSTMLYATYVCDADRRGHHDELVELSLVTLQCT